MNNACNWSLTSWPTDASHRFWRSFYAMHIHNAVFYKQLNMIMLIKHKFILQLVFHTHLTTCIRLHVFRFLCIHVYHYLQDNIKVKSSDWPCKSNTLEILYIQLTLFIQHILYIQLTLYIRFMSCDATNFRKCAIPSSSNRNKAR